MHILLTNDDGHFAPGIQTLLRVMQDQGLRVTMVAPSQEQSAKGMASNPRDPMPLEPIGDSHWHLDGQPADTVMVALRHLLHDDPPDLVVSGINFGSNLGPGLHVSGTVGAAITGTLDGIPALAVSVGMRLVEAREKPPTFPSTHAVLEPAAEFTCEVIDDLKANHQQGKPILPPGVLLNINYPALAADEIAGVCFPEVSDDEFGRLTYRECDESGHLLPGYTLGIDLSRPETISGDVRAHLDGYITVSAVRPRWNVPEEEARAAVEALRHPWKRHP